MFERPFDAARLAATAWTNRCDTLLFAKHFNDLTDCSRRDIHYVGNRLAAVMSEMHTNNGCTLIVGEQRVRLAPLRCATGGEGEGEGEGEK